eukprot:UN21236
MIRLTFPVISSFDSCRASFLYLQPLAPNEVLQLILSMKHDCCPYIDILFRRLCIRKLHSCVNSLMA